MHSSGARGPAQRGPAGEPPVTLIVGEEELLVERAAGKIHETRAADLRPGDLSSLAAPSLFGGGSVVVVRSVQDASSQVAAELVRQASLASPDVVLVLTHAGSAKGKSLLASLVAGGARRIN